MSSHARIGATLTERVTVDHRALRALMAEASRPTPTPEVRHQNLVRLQEAIARHLQATGHILTDRVDDGPAAQADHERLQRAAATLAATSDGRIARGIEATAAALDQHITEEDALLDELSHHRSEHELVGLGFDYGALVDRTSSQ